MSKLSACASPSSAASASIALALMSTSSRPAAEGGELAGDRGAEGASGAGDEAGLAGKNRGENSLCGLAEIDLERRRHAVADEPLIVTSGTRRRELIAHGSTHRRDDPCVHRHIDEVAEVLLRIGERELHALEDPDST